MPRLFPSLPRASRIATLTLGCAATVLVAGCSVATPPSVATLARPEQRPASVRIEPPKTEGGEPARLAEALARALSARGIAVSPDSPFVLTLTVAERPASLGVAQQPPAWLSTPRKHRLFDACHARRLDASLRGGDVLAPAFVARGGFDFCTLRAADIDGLADRFAAALAGS